MRTTKKRRTDARTARFLAKIAALRGRIDRLDGQLVKLLNERTAVALSIGRLKRGHGARIYVPSREQAVLRRVAGLSRGPLTRASLERIYRAVFAASRQGQRRVRAG